MNSFIILGISLFTYMSAWFIISTILKRNDVADIAWGLGFALVAWNSYFIKNDFNLISLIINILVTIWGIRLSSHIFKRNIKKSEDYRYKKWREEWKHFYLRSFFQVFMLQGTLLFMIALPIIFINLFIVKSFTLTILGIIVWLIGFTTEVISDNQLASFLKNPLNKGKILQTGLWKYSRHPNYFGEITLWWGIFIVASSTQYGILSIIGPATITFLITKVSGIPMLEKELMKNPDFIEYSKRTSILIPMPQRKTS